MKNSGKKNVYQKYFISTIAVILSIWIISMAVFMYIRRSWYFILKEETLIISNIKDAKNSMISAHLWLEELIAEDPSIEQEKVWELFESAENKISECIEIEITGFSSEQKFIDSLKVLRASITELRSVAKERLRTKEESEIGGKADQLFDEKFGDVHLKADEVERRMAEHVKYVMKQQYIEDLIALLISTIAIICACYIMFLINRKRRAAEISLNEALENLEAANDELKAGNEEMEAMNEELTCEIEEREIAEKKQRDLIELLEKSKKELFREKKKTDTILASMGDGISIQDRDFNIVYANEFVYRIFGEGVIGRKCYETYEGRKNICEGCPLVITYETGEIARATRLGKGRDGMEIFVDITTSCLKDEHGNIVNGIEVVKNVTEQMTNRREREELIMELEAANHNLNEFAYVVSHDMKAPMRSISSLAGWLIADYESVLDDEGREKLNLISKRAQKMHNMIEGILEYSRAGRDKNDKKQIELNRTVSDVIDMINPPANIKITVGELPGILYNETCAKQIFQNLLANATKYIDKPKGEIEVGCEDDGESLKFHVTDNGIGIDSSDFARIFQVFQKASVKDESESTGIGLSIVKKLVEKSGGKIWVESKVGEGSTFYFTIKKSGSDKDERYKNPIGRG